MSSIGKSRNTKRSGGTEFRFITRNYIFRWLLDLLLKPDENSKILLNLPAMLLGKGDIFQWIMFEKREVWILNGMLLWTGFFLYNYTSLILFCFDVFDIFLCFSWYFGDIMRHVAEDKLIKEVCWAIIEGL